MANAWLRLTSSPSSRNPSWSSSRVIWPLLLESTWLKARRIVGWTLAISTRGTKPRREASVANSSRLRVPFPSSSKSRRTTADCEAVRSRPRSRSIERNSRRDKAPVPLVS
eukprot:scaffold109923_cov30-Tisochrysis_lutea.AAC.6